MCAGWVCQGVDSPALSPVLPPPPVGCHSCLWLMGFTWFPPPWEEFLPPVLSANVPFLLTVVSPVSDLWVNFTLISRPMGHLTVFVIYLLLSLTWV